MGNPEAVEVPGGHSPHKLAPAHAYIAIHNGLCTGVHADCGDDETARFVASVIRGGGFVERVTLDVARGAYMERWPNGSDLRAAAAELNAVTDRLLSRSPAPPATRGAS